MYAFDGRIRYSECDDTGRLSIVSMVNYLQDGSTFQSEDLGHGFATLAPRGIAWILANWRIEIRELPTLGARVRVRTWCYEMTRSHALRCFALEDEAGRELVVADSQWFVFDRSTGHVGRVPEDQRVYLSGEPRADVPPLDRRLIPSGEGTPTPGLVIRRHHLDTNHHTNNAHYIRFAVEALRDLGHEEEISGLSVQYKQMALLGDRIVPYVHRGDEGYDVRITDGSERTFAIVRLRTR